MQILHTERIKQLQYGASSIKMLILFLPFKLAFCKYKHFLRKYCNKKN